MDREERIIEAIKRGYTYDRETGNVIGPKGIITCKSSVKLTS